VSDRIFLRLGVNGALGADELQWILYRAQGQVPLDAPLSTRQWIVFRARGLVRPRWPQNLV